MLKHIVYAALAVMLGLAVMLLPLMIRYQNGFADNSQPQHGEAKETFTISGEKKMMGNVTSKETSTLRGYERLSSRFASSLPYATFIIATGLVVAVTVFVLAKRRF